MRRESTEGSHYRLIFSILRDFVMLAALHKCTFPGESSAYPLPPKAKSLFYEKTLLLFPARLFFNPSIRTFGILFFLFQLGGYVKTRLATLNPDCVVSFSKTTLSSKPDLTAEPDGWCSSQRFQV